MNTKELTYLLQNPSMLKEDHIKALETLNRTFPYFQPSKALLLMCLKGKNSFKYNHELKAVAAYTIDRAVLFDFITSPTFLTKKVVSKQKNQYIDIEVIAPEELKVASRISMDHAVDMNVEEVLDPSLFSTKKEFPKGNINMVEKLIERSEKIQPQPSDKVAPDGNMLQELQKPLEFNKKETHSFKEWLQLSSVKPINRASDTPVDQATLDTKNTLDQSKTLDIIDAFIINNPKIPPVHKKSSSRNLAIESDVAPDELMTETLARVYLAQNKYKKAIQSYKILILKNPEKSGFFADQIKAIQKLQDNK